MPTHTERRPGSTRGAWLLLAAGCLAAAGCAGSDGAVALDPSVAPTVGPHGGPAVPLGGKGYAEIVIEPEGKATRTGRKVVLAVYFLETDLSTPLEPAPTDVSASVLTPEDPEPRAVTLAARPGPGAKPTGGLRFASEVGKFDYDELNGELTATVEGETITRGFAFR